MTTICGHDRDALIWALGEWAGDSVYTRTGPEPLSGILTDDESAAIQALTDPAKLAELLAHEGRRLGVEVHLVRGYDSAPSPEPPKYWAIFATDSFVWIDYRYGSGYDTTQYTMPRARSILAAWLGLEDGDSEGAEQALRGVT